MLSRVNATTFSRALNGFFASSWGASGSAEAAEEGEAAKQPEAWEYLKKDTFGGGNFFNFDSF